MLKKLSFFLLLFFSISSVFSQNHVQKMYSGGELKSEGYMLDNEKTAYWKYYYTNGQMLKEGRYIEGKQAKYWFYYRENGDKIMEGHFDEGQKTNWWIFFESNNQVLKKCEFKGDRLHGYCLYYNNAEIVKAEKYNQGVMEGEWTDMNSFKRDNKQ